MEALSSVVVRARQGDMEAFGELVARFRDMAYGYAYSMLGDFHLAEDAAQEAFIAAYQHLGELREADAFPGWLRRIVFKQCDRITRGRRLDTVPLEAVAEVAADQPAPDEQVTRREMREKVLSAVSALPEHQRTATTLYYINGYSQKEISQFLEVPQTTVKKRLYDSRKKIKERMLDMVSETLKENVPDERFSQKVIQALLARPRPLEVEGHPLREMVEAVRGILPEYEFIEGDEVIAKSGLFEVGDEDHHVYHFDQDRVLRRATVITMLRAMAGRKTPVRLVTAGRVFWAPLEEEQATRLCVFNMLGVLYIEEGADEDQMKATLVDVLEGVVGRAELIWRTARFVWRERCQKVFFRKDDQLISLAGCGMLSAGTLKEGGFDPGYISGYTIGFGLERLAMLKLGLDDVRKLWQPPYVPEGPET